MESNVAQLPFSHRAWAWLEKNQKQAIMGAIGVVVVVVLVWYIVWRQGEKQVRASNALSDAAAQINPQAPASGIPQTYLKVAAEYPNSKAAARAILMAAGALFTDGKYSEAQAQFERFTREHRSSELLPEALLGVASSLEAQGKTEQAITAYKDLLARHPNSSVVTQAKFSLAGLYEVQKRPELARDLYQQVERESRFTVLGSEAGMRLEELAEKNPNLAAAAATNTPSPLPTLNVLPPTGTNAGLVGTNAAAAGTNASAATAAEKK